MEICKALMDIYTLTQQEEEKMQMNKVFIVKVDDCNENDCGCSSESIDSIWLDKTKAEEQAKRRYRGYVSEYNISDAEKTF